MEHRTEGIILQVTPYKDHHRIIQLFTKHFGMVSLFVKGVSTPKLLSLISPLTQLEVIYQKRQSDLYLLRESSLIESHHFLRTNWPLLEAAGKMGRVVLYSQLPGKQAPKLYQLLIASLKQLPHFQEPSTLTTLFYLKLLTHEGVIAWNLPTLFPPSTSLVEPTEEMRRQLQHLVFARSFRALYGQIGFGNFALQLEKVMKALL